MVAAKNNKQTNGFFPTSTDDIAKNTEKMVFGAAHMQGMMLRSMLRYNLEAARFLQHRLEEDLKTAETFSSCASLSELNEASTEFFQRAIEEYTEESSKLTNLGFGLATKTAEEVQAEAAKTSVQ